MPLRKDNLKIILFQLVILPFLFSCNSSSSSSSSTDSNSGSYFVKGGFGLFANGGNGVKYGNFELYLMGLIPPSEVEDIVYFEDVTQSSDDLNNRCSDGEWCPIFHSTSKKHFPLPNWSRITAKGTLILLNLKNLSMRW